MAVTTPRRRAKNPEGKMPLREHLVELRRRLIVSVVAIALGAIAGWFLYDEVVKHLQEPLIEVSKRAGRVAALNYPDVMGSLNLKIKLSAYLGVLVSSPIWLYQIWGFLTPGLTKKERRYGIGFVAAAVPLFLGGVALGWVWLPRAVELLTEFTPDGATNYINAQDYFAFTTRLLLAFGIGFVFPLLLVMLNVVGVLSGRRMAESWRIAVFIAFLFAAVFSPSPDPGGMIALALPMVLLYVIAVFISLWNDRRRAKKRGDDAIFGLADDEASPLPVPAGDIALSSSADLDGPADPFEPRSDRYDAT